MSQRDLLSRTLMAMRNLAPALAIAFIVAASALGQTTVVETAWVRQFGGLGPAPSVAQASDANGNAYIVGRTGGLLVSADGAPQVEAGGTDAFIRKYDPNGTELWTRQFGSPGVDSALGVSIDSEGVYVAGSTTGSLPGYIHAGANDAFVRRYDTNGNEVWTRQFGTAGSETALIALDATGVYIAGSINGGILPGQSGAGGITDGFVRKYDRDGTELWTVQFGTNGSDAVNAVSVDTTGVYVAGSTTATFSSADGILQVYAGGISDAFVRKYAPDGNELWTRQFGGAPPLGSSLAQDVVHAISAHSTGVYVGGFTHSTMSSADGIPQVNLGGGDAFVRKYDANGSHQWTRQFGTPLTGIDDVQGIFAGAAGVYVAGEVFAGALPGQISSGGQDAFVRQYDHNGTEVWTRQFGSLGMDVAVGIAVDATGAYVSGATNGALPGQLKTGEPDAFLRKYSVAGDELWTRQFGTVGPSLDFAEAGDADGNLYVAGQTFGALPGFATAGQQDAFLRKYDPEGNELWTRQFGTVGSDQATAVSTDVTGVVVAGFTNGALPGQVNLGGLDAFIRKYDPEGNELWTRQFGTSGFEQATSVATDATGVYVAGVVATALPGQINRGANDAFLRKYDANGAEIWTRQFGGTGGDQVNAISVHDAGLYLAGQTSGTLPGQTSAGAIDAFVKKYDAAGVEVWTRQFGTNQNDTALAISADDNGVHVAGQALGTFPGETSAGGIDAFLRKYDADGEHVWTRQFGTSGADHARGVSADGTGVYVAGSVTGVLPGQTSSGGIDAFARKYDGEGNSLWTLQFGTEATDRANAISADHTGIYVAGVADAATDAFVLKLLDFLPVGIDIKPGSFPNTINLGSNGAVPVAILGTPWFDAQTVEPASVTVAGATVKLKGNGTAIYSLEDVNADGILDLLVHVNMQASELTDSDTQAILRARMTAGQRVWGVDVVQIVP